MNISLKNKKAVICGSTQGIGLATAEELAMLGASCTLMARNETALKDAVAKLDISNGQQHNYLVADFSDTENVKKLIESHVAKNDVHILINNTGGPPPGPIIEATEDSFLNTFKQHLICNQVLTQAVVPSMKREGYGRIINIISTSVRIPVANLGVSNTIRGAVASWSKTMANELGQFNITVNNILPGYTKTGRLDSLIKNIAASKNKSVAQVENEMQNDIPMKRFGIASEVAAVAAFVASPAASYLNGVNIPVDGGKIGAI